MSLRVPLQINNRNIYADNQHKDVVLSINQFIDLIVSTRLGGFIPCYDFGFAFQNARYQSFSFTNASIDSTNINSTSKNKENFAYLLKKSIEKFETRLSNIFVTMNYNPDEIKITILIEGKINVGKPEKYNRTLEMIIW
jgi:hypothetical protein